VGGRVRWFIYHPFLGSRLVAAVLMGNENWRLLSILMYPRVVSFFPSYHKKGNLHYILACLFFVHTVCLCVCV
jgi:hypothetical protein